MLQQDQLERYIPRSLVHSLIWSISGDAKFKARQELGDYIRGVTTIPLPPNPAQPIIDFEVRVERSYLIEIFI